MCVFVFFFKQKTAYELRISDWSSDVCSSDLKLLPYSPIADFIDFSIQCNPIFMYPEDAKAAGANRPLAPNTLTRIAAGVERFVIEADEPYIVSYYGPKNGKNSRGKALTEPLPTQTTENRFAIVNPLISQNGNSACRARVGQYV